MFKVGILGCGHIAETMAKTINDTDGVTLHAVAAREKERADAFKEKWNAKKSYGSYEGLLNDEERKVQFFLDRDFLEEPGFLGVHPNDNTATVWLKTGDMLEILREHGNPVNVVEI